MGVEEKQSFIKVVNDERLIFNLDVHGWEDDGGGEGKCLDDDFRDEIVARLAPALGWRVGFLT